MLRNRPILLIEDNHLKMIPIVIIAESHEEQKIVQGFELGVAGYVVKPQETAKNTNTVKAVMETYLSRPLQENKHYGHSNHIS